LQKVVGKEIWIGLLFILFLLLSIFGSGAILFKPMHAGGKPHIFFRITPRQLEGTTSDMR
jgi:hypothetical protein